MVELFVFCLILVVGGYFFLPRFRFEREKPTTQKEPVFEGGAEEYIVFHRVIEKVKKKSHTSYELICLLHKVSVNTSTEDTPYVFYGWSSYKKTDDQLAQELISYVLQQIKKNE